MHACMVGGYTFIYSPMRHAPPCSSLIHAPPRSSMLLARCSCEIIHSFIYSYIPYPRGSEFQVSKLQVPNSGRLCGDGGAGNGGDGDNDDMDTNTEDILSGRRVVGNQFSLSLSLFCLWPSMLPPSAQLLSGDGRGKESAAALPTTPLDACGLEAEWKAC